jgi:exosortase
MPAGTSGELSGSVRASVEPTTQSTDVYRNARQLRRTIVKNATDWVAVLLLALIFAPAVSNMAGIWSTRDYYSHGYLVPFVSLWALAGLRPRLRRLSSAPDSRAIVALLVVGTLYVGGLGASIVSLQGVALVGAVAAALWARRGLPWLRALAFPVAFLLFMVPLPDAWLSPVIVSLQLGVSQVGVALLRVVGFHVYRDGNVLELPGGESLFVAEACSGITSLITLVPLGVVLAYFTEQVTWRRAALMAAVVPLALLGNLIRVIGTVVAAQRWGAEAATAGSVHEAAGALTYVLGCVALLAVGVLLRKIVPEQKAVLAR